MTRRFRAVSAATVLAGLLSAGAARSSDQQYQVVPLEPTSTESRAKVRGVGNPDLVSVIVKLNAPSVAAYKGEIAGLAATNARATGASRLNLRSAAAVAYERHLAQNEQAFEQAARARIPSARITHRYRKILGGVAMTLPRASVVRPEDPPRGRRGLPGLPRSPEHGPQPGIHRRPDLVAPGGRPLAGRRRRDRGRDRLGGLARAPLPGRRRHLPGAPGEVGGHGLRVRLRESQRRRLRLQSQAARRPAFHDHLRHLRSGAPGRRVPLGARQQRPRQPHRHHGRRQRRRPGRIQRHAPRHRQRDCASRSCGRVQGLLHRPHRPGLLLSVRLGGRDPAGHRRRSGRAELLDRRREQPLLRPRRARLPRCLRSGNLRGRFGGQRRPRRGIHGTSRPLGDDRRRQHHGSQLPGLGRRRLGLRLPERDRSLGHGTSTHGARRAQHRGSPLPEPRGSGQLCRADRGLQAGNQRPSRQGLQRPSRRRRGHDPLQPHPQQPERRHPLSARPAYRRGSRGGAGGVSHRARGDDRQPLRRSRRPRSQHGRHHGGLQLARRAGPDPGHQQARHHGSGREHPGRADPEAGGQRREPARPALPDHQRHLHVQPPHRGFGGIARSSSTPIGRPARSSRPS